MVLVTYNNYAAVEEENSGFVSELATQRLYHTNNHNEMTKLLVSLPPLGLHLRKESSLLDLIETRLNPQQLSEAPLFFKETDPQPRRHTLWSSASDFTHGQATICRIHHMEFAPGAFDRHFEKLVAFEPRFLNLCRTPFPSSNQSTFFYSNFPNNYTNHNNNNNINYGTKQLHQQQHPCPTSSSTNMSYFPQQHYQVCNESSTEIMELSQANYDDDEDEACWAQKMTNNNNNNKMRQGLCSTIVTVTPPQNYYNELGDDDQQVYDDQFQSGDDQLLSFSDQEYAINSNDIFTQQQQVMGISINHPFGSLTSMEEARINISLMDHNYCYNYGQENYYHDISQEYHHFKR
ncbi:hypothetical protein CsatB_030488 [Cannabis sativa]